MHHTATRQGFVKIPLTAANRLNAGDVHRRATSSSSINAWALPSGAGLMLVLGAAAAGTHGALGGAALLVSCAITVTTSTAVSESATAIALGVVGWMVVNAFASAPFGQLRPGDSAAAAQAAVIGAAAGAGALIAAIRRLGTRGAKGATLVGVSGLAGYAAAVTPRRRAYALLGACLSLPTLTWLLTDARQTLSLADDLLIYLLVVVLVTVVGGFWPAILSAVAASLLVNWFFTEPFHTLTIDRPDNLLALLLFIIVAVSVSSVVHLAARRAQLAAQSHAESEGLLTLGRLVVGGHDTPGAILDHLHSLWGVGLQLQERAGAAWVTVAASGPLARDVSREIAVRDDLRIRVHGALPSGASRLAEAAAGQAAAALDRDRLRTQAAQAEALAAGNRMRTALLAAVSHELRTPVASLKASVSSLRQTDVAWSPTDEAELLETVEQSTDRLAELIANLLDMSRVQTGALQPFVRPTALDEIVPVAMRGLPGQSRVGLDLPENLPLVLTDAGLLERALANLLSNALRHSPPSTPPQVVARERGDRIEIAVIDHGPGVRSWDKLRMFEPFQRLGDQTAGTGVGLGLAVARGFVESLGGSLTATDTRGGGLTMTIRLPAARARPVAGPAGRSGPQPADSHAGSMNHEP